MTQPSFLSALDLHKDRLLRFAFNLTRNQDDAKDLLQETYFRALTNREKFQEGTNLKAWLLTIMRNLFINNYRKKAKTRVLFDSTDNLFFLNSGSNSTGNQGESNILMDELTHMVDELDESIRYPFVKHYEGYKYQEIADDMQLPLGTVKSRIFFARQDLKSKIVNRYGNTLGLKERELKMAS
ncbi:MAG TPA: RNA polymerase sigma factor [Saprospiraceae bacterium]|nr:RNA polymerase sigma factor [Saprospiraceae bacterium]HNT19979.1 RNA polymerase sigma factor [Saprospiraceae bacterium]